MDHHANVFQHTQGKPPHDKHTHIFGQSDGGCRYLGTSATGYSIKTCNTSNNTLTEITTGGNHINYNMSSLTAETHALDELTDRITQWIQGTSTHYTSTTNTYTPSDQTDQTTRHSTQAFTYQPPTTHPRNTLDNPTQPSTHPPISPPHPYPLEEGDDRRSRARHDKQQTHYNAGDATDTQRYR